MSKTDSGEIDSGETREDEHTLASVVSELRIAYDRWKDSERDKEHFKGLFYEFADEEIRKQGLALKLVDIEASSEAVARERALRHHPGWTLDTYRPHRTIKDAYEVILIEDPALKPFVYEHDGVRYARQVSKGAVMVDDGWLQEKNPELYEAVTYELPWGERIMVPIEHLNKELIALLGKYIYNAKPRVSLPAPRALKDGE